MAFSMVRASSGAARAEVARYPRRGAAAGAAADDAWLQGAVAAAREGDAEALGALYDRYSPEIYRYLARRCGDTATAEDLTSIVFTKVLEALHRDLGWRASFVAWLYRIAHNALADHLRAAGRRPQAEMPESLTDPEADEPSAEGHRALEAEWLTQALATLRPRHAEIVALRFAEGLTIEQVAERTWMTISAVKVTQHRALNALRRRLAARREGLA
jgi:RNA polymerase sigma-70 factor (ECF subfamily)